MIDHEAVVADLEAHLVRKHQDGNNSFGYRELIDLLADLRVAHRLAEGLPEKALRVYGPALQEALIKNHQPHTATADSASAEMAEPFIPSMAHNGHEGASHAAADRSQRQAAAAR